MALLDILHYPDPRLRNVAKPVAEVNDGVRRLIEPVLPGLPVISLAELPPHIGLDMVGTWDMN